jgi:peptidoglycan hydrolase CwlO-like protein
MSLKLKIIGLIILLVIIISTIISLFVYINKLNNEITNLNVTVTNQEQTITQLNNNIQSLEMNLTAIYNTINITNDYIDQLGQLYSKESTIKQEIYNEVIKDENTSNWYNTEIPDNLINALLSHDDSIMCEDNNTN